jgi:GT2 family glycosyltransferase
MPEAAPVDVSICVVSWNVWEDLRRCLESLRLSPEVTQEILVVDNASSDGTPQRLREAFPEVRLIENSTNRGFAAASNQALAAATGRYLWLLNPDTLVPPGGLAEFLAFADQHPEAGIIGPQQRYPDGRLQASVRAFPTIRAALFRGTPLGVLFPRAAPMRDYLMSDWDHESVREVDWVSGAAMLIRRECYEQIGPLDEGFFWSSEDVDYCWRAHEAGWKVLFTPRPAIIHAVGRSRNRVRTRTILRQHRAMYRLYRKHLARSLPLALLVGAAIWLRAGGFLLRSWLDSLLGR